MKLPRKTPYSKTLQADFWDSGKLFENSGTKTAFLMAEI
jgi:hypothetical protein